MSNPYEGKSTRRSNETRNDRAGFMARLIALGCDRDEVEAFDAVWDSFDDDWTPERRAAVMRMSDEELVNEIVTARVEHVHNTVPPDAGLLAVGVPTEADLMAIAVELLTESATQIMSWVGDDGDRARLMRALEIEREQPRTTLLAKLDRVAVRGELDGTFT